MAFVHLHVHSQFSLLDGTAGPKDLAKRAAKLGMSALALTDTANLFGAVAFFKACKDVGVKAIIGAELFVDPSGMAGEPSDRDPPYNLVALVEDETGYANLCKLVTDAIFEGMHQKPRVDLARIARHKAGLVFLTGGPKGAFGRALARGDAPAARARMEELAAVLGPEQLFLELQDLGLDAQPEINAGVRALARELGYRTAVTNAVHHLDPEDAAVLDVLNAISLGASLGDPSWPRTQTDQAYFKSEEEMRDLFPDDPEAIDVTAEIAERCHYKFTFGTYHFPATTPPDVDEDGTQPDTVANWEYFYRAFPPPRDYGLPDPGEAIPAKPSGAGNLDGYFEWYGREGLKLRLERIAAERHAAYWERLEGELKMIERMGFPAYLLIVAEFINWSKDNDIPVGPGRGSAAGSLVAWAMRITDIDPIRFELLFERFLNPARISMPDIDVDFCQDRREEAIQHVREKYGYELVSQIITYGTLKAKAAVRDVARVLDLSFNEADRIAKLVPEALGTTLQQALDEVPQLEELRRGDPKVRRVLDLAMRIEGMNRQTGVHAAGVVIADKPLVEYAPLYRDEPGGGPVVQYDMKSAESIGLIKFDFLGLKTLDQIRDTAIAVERNHGVKLDMLAIPDDDEATYRLLQAGDALGVFQLESSGMRELLTRLAPNVIDDLVALVALYRPGPLKSGMVDDFVDRKHGRKRVEYPLPMLEPILRNTYGTIVYQEQVMQVAQVMGGYSLGEADLLRRAMGKKDKNEMARQKLRFVEGSVANAIDEQKASEIFDLLAMFAEYGFNKSHSAAYGFVSYQTAWLKTHYRAEYMAALMTIDAAATDKILIYLEDCRKAGIAILPVCVNGSHREFHVAPYEPGSPGTIRFGLSAVKGVGEGAIEAIVEARGSAGGRFASPSDFFERIDDKRVNRRVFEALIKAGALDFSGVARAALFAGLEDAIAAAERKQADRAAGQASLFGGLGARPAPGFRFPDEPEWPLSKKLANEKEVLGLYLTGHPMQALAKDVEMHATAPIARLAERPTEHEVRVLGIPVDTRIVKTKRGDRMAFVRVEDATGGVECVFFADPWSRSQKVLQSGEPVLVTGRLEIRDDEPKLKASTAELLADLRARSTREVRFQLAPDELAGRRLDRFRDILRDQRGECAAVLVLSVPGRGAVELELPDYPVDPGTGLEEAVQSLFGRPGVVALS